MLESVIAEEQKYGLVPHNDPTNSRLATAKVCVSLLLYICSQEPDIEGRQSSAPANPAPEKTKKGLKFFPPSAPVLWEIGKKLGDALRKYEQQTETREGSHTSKRPHIRAAHWHRFLIGKRDIEARKYTIKWLHPMMINVEEE
jgi:hypothetical protein